LYDTATKQSLQDASLSSVYPQVSQIVSSDIGDFFVTSCSRDFEVTQNSSGRIELWKLTPSHVGYFIILSVCLGR